MTDFIKFGQGIADFLTKKVGGFSGVKYKITHKELEELALQNENVMKVLEELGIDKQKHTYLEIHSKAKSNYEIASIRIKNATNTFLNGGYSVSKEKTGDVSKYHFSTRDNVYNGYKTFRNEKALTAPNSSIKLSDEEIIELYKNGASIEEISGRTWTSQTAISKIIPDEINKYTVKGKTSLKEIILEKYKTGMKTDDIAEELGIAASTVTRKLPSELKNKRKSEKALHLHINIVKMHEQGLPPKEIAKNLGLNEPTVYVHLKRHRQEQGIADTINDNKENVIELFKQGVHPAQIAKTLGITKATVYGHLPKELKPGNSKITAELLESIIKMRKTGLSAKEIGEQLGLSEDSVRRALPKELKVQYQTISPELTNRIIELRKEGYQLEDIATKTGISRGAVKKRLPEELRHRIVVPKETRIKIEKMNSEGMPPEEIAENLEIKLIEVKTSIRYPLKKETELPEETKILIFEKRKSGMSVEEISKDLGIKFLDINKNLPPEMRQKRQLTDEVIAKIIEMRKMGKHNIEIANELGISRESVINHTPEEYRMSTKKLTQLQRNKILEMRLQGSSTQQIADELKIHISTVENNLPEELKPKTKVTKEEIKKIIEMRKAGISIDKICEETGYSNYTIYRYLPEELVLGNAKVDEKLRKIIITKRLEGKSTNEIAQELNLSCSTIQRAFPQELKSLRANIDEISEDEFKEAVLKGKTLKGVCEQLKIGMSALNRLRAKYGVISKSMITDIYKENSAKKYEQFNNDKLKERFFNVVSSLYDSKKIDESSELGNILDNITNELLSNHINIETREKFIKLIRTLDLAERKIVTSAGLARSKELAEVKNWASTAKKLDSLKERLNYTIHTLLPQNKEFELAQILSKYKIENLDNPNIEVLNKYIQKLADCEDITKECAKILRIETYKNANPEIKLLADKYSVSVLGKIEPETAGRYIRNLIALDTPKMEMTYPKNYISIMNKSNLPKPLCARYLTTLDEWFENADLEKATLKEFCKKFDINENLGNKIIEEYLFKTYAITDTKIMTKGDNGSEMESIFAPGAKNGVIEQFKFPKCIKWITDFEDAMTIFIPPDAHRSGIKYMKNRGEYEVKLSDESNRLLSSDKTLHFDIYRREGLHTKKKNRY